jgi:hypothetical protein
MGNEVCPCPRDSIRIYWISDKDVIPLVIDAIPPKMRCDRQSENLRTGILAPKGFQLMQSFSVNPCVKNIRLIMYVDGLTTTARTSNATSK